MADIDVSIVIVCMNKLDNLYPCLNSIKQYTNVSYEVFVVAYLFSKENLEKVRLDFPWVNFIESNEIRGFAENNNLALRLAQGKYCFVQNDDTELKMPVIDTLCSDFERSDEKVALFCPKLLYADGSVQYCGVGEYSFGTIISREYSFNPKRKLKSDYIDKPGIFETLNACGAAFLIRTDVFREMGFFDEKYFFCPEDLALTVKLRENGYRIFVDSDAYIYHKEGGTWGKLRTATMPTQLKGEQIFSADSGKIYYWLFALLVFPIRFFKTICWKLKTFLGGDEKSKIMAKANWNVCKSLFSSKTPKEIFVSYYLELKK
ncbi:MAG: glycosyltransferase [Paludibacteraceae bacterium]|nr:glycosyltransferase [Paludibacteraceae bacterium]